MKVLKKIGIGLGVIVALLLVIPLFTKKEYSVVRETVIARPKAVVFDYIVLLKNQDNFSVWAQMDKNMKKSYKGTDGQVGFVSAWESKDDKVGAGEQEIKKILPGERIDYELRFLKPFGAGNRRRSRLASAGRTGSPEPDRRRESPRLPARSGRKAHRTPRRARVAGFRASAIRRRQ